MGMSITNPVAHAVSVPGGLSTALECSQRRPYSVSAQRLSKHLGATKLSGPGFRLPPSPVTCARFRGEKRTQVTGDGGSRNPGPLSLVAPRCLDKRCADTLYGRR